MPKFTHGNHIVSVVGKFGPFLRVEVEAHLSSRLKSFSKSIGSRYIVHKKSLLKTNNYDFH